MVWMCFWNLLAAKHIYLAQGGIFSQNPTNEAKFSSKMSFFWHGKMAFLIFLAKNTSQDASKYNSEPGNEKKTSKLI